MGKNSSHRNVAATKAKPLAEMTRWPIDFVVVLCCVPLAIPGIGLIGFVSGPVGVWLLVREAVVTGRITAINTRDRMIEREREPLSFGFTLLVKVLVLCTVIAGFVAFQVNILRNW